jgi:hypothetical protein
MFPLPPPDSPEVHPIVAPVHRAGSGVRDGAGHQGAFVGFVPLGQEVDGDAEHGATLWCRLDDTMSVDGMTFWVDTSGE